MRQYSTVQSSLTCRYTLGNILPSLPGPGTPAFTRLTKELKRFGATAEKITLETPTTRLSDVRLTILLLQDTVTIRLQYQGFEIFVPSLMQGNGDVLLEIAKVLVSALQSMDEDAGKGQLTLHSLAHLRLESGDPEEFLGEHLTRRDVPYRADAFAYYIPSRQGDSRIVVARSALFEGSLFVDYIGEYPEPRFTPEMIHQAQADYADRLSALGLSEARL